MGKYRDRRIIMDTIKEMQGRFTSQDVFDSLPPEGSHIPIHTVRILLSKIEEVKRVGYKESPTTEWRRVRVNVYEVVSRRSGRL